MNNQLKGIIHYICSRYPREVTRTVLVKLVYLSDVEFRLRYWRNLTDVIYMYDHFGPFSWSIPDTAQELVDEGVLTKATVPNFYGEEKHRYKANINTSEYYLDKHTRGVLSIIVNKYSQYSFTGLLDYVYSTPPLTHFKRGEVIDFNVLNESNQLEPRLDRILGDTLKHLKDDINKDLETGNYSVDYDYSQDEKNEIENAIQLQFQ